MKKIQALQFFAEGLSTQGAPLCIKQIGMKTIGNPEDFSRPALIAVVKRLEEATGKRLLAAGLTPLKYLGCCQIDDLAAYFSDEGCPKIEALRERYNVYPKTPEDMLKAFKAKLIEAYAENCFKENNEDFLKLKAGDCVPDILGPSSNWYIPLTWIQNEFDVSIPYSAISSETKVQQIVDLICLEYSKQLTPP